MILNTETKFDIGGDYYTYVTYPVKHECQVCEGKKYITYNGFTIKCPNCCGTGNIHNSKEFGYRTEKYHITGVKISINSKNEISVRYKGIIKTSEKVKHRSEMNVFATVEEAQAVIDANNNRKLKERLQK